MASNNPDYLCELALAFTHATHSHIMCYNVILNGKTGKRKRGQWCIAVSVGAGMWEGEIQRGWRTWRREDRCVIVITAKAKRTSHDYLAQFTPCVPFPASAAAVAVEGLIYICAVNL
ncbi:hypothetical protein WMY93_014619 [Mugilogobius chulae]|uniref:Uncharacterized protein n=1 Tax=Mugilogobius chulae TaxID=88201 RepID=A0AAW0P729_9GOBI